jgi:membrane protease YdiL (CAAX protease family)
MVIAVGSRSPTDVQQLSMTTLVALHLVPGALMTAGFVALAPVIEAIGFPPIMGLLVVILVILVPFELGVLRWAAREQHFGLIEVVPYRRPVPRRDWLWLVPALIALAFLGFGLSMAVEPQLIAQLFSWLPEWFVRPILLDRIGDYSAAAWLITLAAYFAINGLIGPIVEEFYFRGFLLPRMERLGRWAPLVNVSLFSLYHFWSPWQLAARIIALAPMVYAVRWKRNVYLGMAVHCSLNSLGVLIIAMTVIGPL